MDQLAVALVAVFSPERRRPPLSVEMATLCDSEFIESHLAHEAELARGGPFKRVRSKVRKLGRARLPFNPNVYGERLQLMGQGRWRYDKVDEFSEVIASVGCDETECWSQNRGGERMAVQPTTPHGPYSLSESTWQFHASLSLREIVEPELMMPALAVSAAAPAESVFGAAVRMVGRPHHADRVESALLLASADTCVVDVHLETGIVLLATSFSEDDTALVSHVVQSLAYGDQSS